MTAPKPMMTAKRMATSALRKEAPALSFEDLFFNGTFGRFRFFR